jgi:pimeloyl-ACP methyl ester carboxylesterase
MTEMLVRIGNDQVWVQDSGGEGPVVLLLHPGIADSRAWDVLWPALAAESRVVRFDVRAFGRSPAATEAYTIADDALAVLDHLGVPRVHLVGCSMGGSAALDVTVLHPGRVASLTLLCPGVNGYAWPDEPELEAEFERLVADDDQEGLLGFGLRMWAAAAPDDPVVVELMRDAGAAQANEDEFLTKPPPTFDRLHEIAVRTVLMVGDLDHPALVAADLAVAERIPDCELVLMPGVDHLPMLREPAWVLRTILEQIAG